MTTPKYRPGDRVIATTGDEDYDGEWYVVGDYGGVDDEEAVPCARYHNTLPTCMVFNERDVHYPPDFEGFEVAKARLRSERRLTLYRDDSTAQVVYEHVKTWFWTAGNTVLVVSRYVDAEGPAHHYIHWPRERFCWFKDEAI